MKRFAIRLLLVVMPLIIALPSVTHAQRARVNVGVTIRSPHPVVRRQAHVVYSTMPRWGATVKTVPVGAVRYRYRREPYFYHGGAFYRPHPAGYVVVRPRWGLRVNVLPVGYRTIMVGPVNYYYYYGTFYQPYNGAYEVVAPPVGAVVDSLPDGYTIENVNGAEYYVLDGVTYAEVDAPEYPDGIGYQVIKVN